MKKIMHGGKLFIFFFLVTSQTSSVERVTKIYPELIPFFKSEQFQNNIQNFSIEVIEADEYKMATEIQLTRNGIKRFLIISSSLLNKDVISAEEIKFMICHELGHVNDPNLFWHGVIPIVTWCTASGLGVLYLGFQSFKDRPQLIQKFLKIAGASFLGLTVVQYLARQGEYFADKYGIALTHNKEVACSFLKKRYEWQEKKNEKKSFFVRLLSRIFADHPSAHQRIEKINKKILK
jgi:Zn-dependent protease with chaperone function